MKTLAGFKLIEGATVRTIKFDEGYLLLELDLGGMSLSVLPIVQIGKTQYTPDGDDYRKAVASLAGRSISDVFAPDERTIVIFFDEGASLTVSRDENTEPEEILVFEKPGEAIVVW